MAPRVPTRQVADQVLPSVRQSANATAEQFGGQDERTFAAQQNAISGLVDAGLKAKQEIDDARTKESYSQLVKIKNEMFWNPEKGAVSRKEANAANVVNDYMEQYKKATDKVREGLSNESQRAMFDQMATKEGDELHGMLSRHASNESQAYKKTSTMASVAAARNDAINNYAMPGKVEDSINTQVSSLTSYLSQQGLKKPEIDVEVAKVKSDTYAGVIDRMLALGNDKQAKEYFESVKDGIEVAETRKTLEKSLRTGSIRGESQRLSDEYISSSKSMSEALAKANEIEDSDVRDATVDRLKNKYATAETAKLYDSERTMANYVNTIETTKSLDSIPPNEWDALEPEQKKSLYEYHQYIVEGRNVPTDMQTLYDLKTLASSAETQDDFMKMNLLDYASKLSTEDRKELINLQTAMRKADPSAKKILDGYRTDQDIVNGTLNSMGINTATKNENEKKRINQFRMAVDAEVVATQEKTGKKVNNIELQAIADRFATKVITSKGWFWNTEKHAFELTPEDKGEIDVTQIPAKEIPRLQETLRKYGRPVTNEAMAELYLKAIRGARASAK